MLKNFGFADRPSPTMRCARGTYSAFQARTASPISACARCATSRRDIPAQLIASMKRTGNHRLGIVDRAQRPRSGSSHRCRQRRQYAVQPPRHARPAAGSSGSPPPHLPSLATIGSSGDAWNLSTSRPALVVPLREHRYRLTGIKADDVLTSFSRCVSLRSLRLMNTGADVRQQATGKRPATQLRLGNEMAGRAAY